MWHGLARCERVFSDEFLKFLAGRPIRGAVRHKNASFFRLPHAKVPTFGGPQSQVSHEQLRRGWGFGDDDFVDRFVGKMEGKEAGTERAAERRENGRSDGGTTGKGGTGESFAVKCLRRYGRNYDMFLGVRH